jgi:hypothetical protein
VSVPVEEAIDAVYAAELDRFVETRDAQARALRDEGRRDDAATIAGLRKPTVPAWTINQLARRRRREIDLLLDAGRRLVDGQRSALAGSGRAELDRARKTQEDALAALLRSSRDLFGNRASETTLRRIEETLRAAAVSPEGRELLAKGRFEREGADTGWSVLESLAGTTGRGAATARAGKPCAPSEERRRAQEQLRAARERRAAAEKAPGAAERKRARAARELEAAERDVATAEQELEAALEAVEAAEREAGA